MGSHLPPLVMVPALLWDDGLYGRQVEALGDIVRPIPLVIAEQNWNAAAEAVLERAPAGRFLLAGTSFGGSLALEVAARAPDRVAGLWLSGCHAGPSRARV